MTDQINLELRLSGSEYNTDFSAIIMKGAPTITTLQSCYSYISTSTRCFVLYEVDVVGFHFIGF